MDTNKFVNRHVGISAEDIPAMLETIGVKSLDELIDQTIPANIRLKEPLNLPEAMTEREFAEHIAELASKNEVFTGGSIPRTLGGVAELPDCYLRTDRIALGELLATRRGDSGSRGGYHVSWFTQPCAGESGSQYGIR